MKYLLLILIISSCYHKTTNSIEIPRNNRDSLKKYSYELFLKTSKDSAFVAACFFYKIKDRTILVTNYHCITGMNPFDQKIEHHSDSLYVILPTKYKDSIYTFDISEKNIGKTEIFWLLDKPDLFSMDITLPKNVRVNYINDLIDTSYFNMMPNEVISYGYPCKENADKCIDAGYFHLQKDSFISVYDTDGVGKYLSSVKMGFIGITNKQLDTLKDKVESKYIFASNQVLNGFSGSPVFGRFAHTVNGIKVDSYKFIGIICGNNPPSNQTWIIKGSLAYQYIYR